MGELVNLNRARKRRDKTAADQQAEANRAKYGRTSAEKQAEAARAEHAAKALDQHQLRDEDAT